MAVPRRCFDFPASIQLSILTVSATLPVGELVAHSQFMAFTRVEGRSGAGFTHPVGLCATGPNAPAFHDKDSHPSFWNPETTSS